MYKKRGIIIASFFLSNEQYFRDRSVCEISVTIVITSATEGEQVLVQAQARVDKRRQLGPGDWKE